MFKIKYKLSVSDYLSDYFRYYREYYQKLYEDSGLWNENQIINGYIAESKKRKEEIIELIEKNLSEDNILGKTLENTLFIKWRTKYIFIKWFDDEKLKIRYISRIEIR